MLAIDFKIRSVYDDVNKVALFAVRDVNRRMTSAFSKQRLFDLSTVKVPFVTPNGVIYFDMIAEDLLVANLSKFRVLSVTSFMDYLKTDRSFEHIVLLDTLTERKSPSLKGLMPIVKFTDGTYVEMGLVENSVGEVLENNNLGVTEDSQLVASIDTMLSTEIAKLTGKRHDNVIRDIESIVKQLKTDSSNLSSGFKSSTYLAGNGKYEKCYELDYEATIVLITGYDAVMRSKVINRWLTLERQVVAQVDTKPVTKGRLTAMVTDYVDALLQLGIPLIDAQLLAREMLTPETVISLYKY